MNLRDEFRRQAPGVAAALLTGLAAKAAVAALLIGWLA